MRLLFVILFVLASPAVATAQQAMPIGLWANADNSEQLYVGADQQCYFAAAGGVPFGGPCGWNATYSGGILTIINGAAYQPAPVYFNVTWINERTISLEGDILYLRN